MEFSDEKLMSMVVSADNDAFIAGVEPKKRVFPVIQSVMRQLGYESYVLAGLHEDPLVGRIQRLHSSMYRSKDLATGGVHGGVYMFRDVFVQISIPMIYGQVELDILSLTDMSDLQKKLLCMNPEFLAQFADQLIDVFDFGAGLVGFDDAVKLEDELLPKFELAKYQLHAAAAVLCSSFDYRGALQSGLLAAELVLKAGLSASGYTASQLKGLGHNLDKCVSAFCEKNSAADFDRMSHASKALPKFVENRYSSAQPDRRSAGEFVMTSQYIAGEVVRQFSKWSIRERIVDFPNRSYP
ncbi:hypothetical protein P8T57_07035 [Thalassospira sp. SN3W]|uniref:hypothetical protein n=1 Tax=Thalassospira sp. SN3W TaxID=3035476 RepID=UPI00311ADEAC